MNLNEVLPITDRDSWTPDRTINTQSLNANITVHFDNIENICCDLIKEANLVVGCVAWLTSDAILNALTKPKDGCQIVVQKEDFLRPDNKQKLSLRLKYDRLHCAHDRYTIGEYVGALSYCSDPTVEPVRCCGNHNSNKAPAHPRMHNKFLVLCKEGGTKIPTNLDETEFMEMPTPYAVITGSYNMSYNATQSFENIVHIKDEKIAKAYFDEWQWIYSLSEPLNWYKPWIEPEYRYGS